MQEFVKDLIERYGAMWAQTADRTTSPVLVTRGQYECDAVYMLTLPPNEPHPFWRVEERNLTTQEAHDIEALLKITPDGIVGHEMACIGSMLPPDYNNPQGPQGVGETWQTLAYVKNGRRNVWGTTMQKVRVTIEKI